MSKVRVYELAKELGVVIEDGVVRVPGQQAKARDEEPPQVPEAAAGEASSAQPEA